MTFKPVELQIAVPRTTELTRIQQEMQNRQSMDQQGLAAQSVKLGREAAQRSAEVNEASESAVRDDGERGGGEADGRSGSRERTGEKAKDAEHPYKGRRFDISL